MESVLIRLCFLVLAAVLVKPAESLPTEDNSSFYNEIVKKCPQIEGSDYLHRKENKALLDTCKDWKKITSVKAITEDTKSDIGCLLYFNSFSLYCQNPENINKPIDKQIISKYNLGSVCDKLAVISDESEIGTLLHNIIKTKDACTLVCANEFELLAPICRYSIYFSDLVTAAKPKPVISNNTQVNDQQEVNTKNDNKESEVAQSPNEPQNIQDNIKPVKIETDTKLHPEPIKKPAQPELPTESNKKTVIASPVLDPPVVDGAIAPENKKPEVAPVEPEEKQLNPETEVKKTDQDTAKVSDENVNPPGKTQNDPPQLDEDAENDMGEVGDPIQETVAYPEESEDDTHPETKAEKKISKPVRTDESDPINYTTELEGDSYFFTYFMVLCAIFILGYVCYHNKQKLLALILEGRKGRRQYRGRRPNSANYHKLDSNLEEAITSSCSKNSSNVLQ